MARWFEKGWLGKLLSAASTNAAKTPAPAAQTEEFRDPIIEALFTAQDLKALELKPAAVHIQDLKRIIDPVLDAIGLRLIRDKNLTERQLTLRGWRALENHLDRAISAVSVDETKKEMNELRAAISTVINDIEKSKVDGPHIEVSKNAMDTLATHYELLQTGTVALGLGNPDIGKKKLGPVNPDQVARSVLMAAETGFIDYYRRQHQRQQLLAEDQSATQRYISHE